MLAALVGGLIGDSEVYYRLHAPELGELVSSWNSVGSDFGNSAD